MTKAVADLLAGIPHQQIPVKILNNLTEFLENYLKGLLHPIKDRGEAERLLRIFASLVFECCQNPPLFELFHPAVRKPIDYHQFGLDLIRLLIDFKASKLIGLECVDQMEEQLARGENVILLANHQIEADPQVIALLLQKSHPKFAQNMIFVAGHRVTTDPLAIPFSLGCNLLCIYSKKYINHPAEEKHQKMLHNQKTLKKMEHLLNRGGCCIYVAPSGGRDRPNAEGQIEVASFDPQNVELFYLIAKQAEPPVHFYPLAINSFHLLPPPSQVSKELGEPRLVQSGPAHIAFSPELDMDHFPGSDHSIKKVRRELRASYAWQCVKEAYSQFLN